MRFRPVALAVVFAALAASPRAQTQAQDPFTAPGVHGPGPGVTNPLVLSEQKPTYTPDAMRAKIQGVAEVEVIIQENGVVGAVRIHKSLDRQFGLDAKALEAAQKWRFKPAMRDGKAVPFKAIIQLEFKLDSSFSDGQFGLGAYRQATPGLVMPRVKREEKPTYTSAALNRGIQGVVEVEAVIGSDGKVERSRVVKSLDTEHGLDKQALIAANGWAFEPGMLNGKPVPVIVVIQLEFRTKK